MTTITHFKGTFLNPTERFIYEQVNRQNKETKHNVICVQHKNYALFPFCDVKPLGILDTARFLALKNGDVFKKYLGDSNLLHVHFGNYANRFVKVKEELGIPLITTFYGMDLVKKESFYDPLIDKGDINIAISNDMAKKLHEIGFKKSTIRVWNIGIDTSRFVPSNTLNDHFVFLIVARFVEKKGIGYAIDAFNEVVKLYPDCELRIVGAGPKENELKMKVLSYRITDKVTFINNFKEHRPSSVVLGEYQNANALIVPSISTKNDYEGTPIVVLEAGASGLPVIASNIGGIPEQIVHNKTGLLFPEKNIETLSWLMRDLISDKQLSETLGNNARQHIEKNFNKEIQLQKLDGIYNKLL